MIKVKNITDEFIEMEASGTVVKRHLESSTIDLFKQARNGEKVRIMEDTFLSRLNKTTVLRFRTDGKEILILKRWDK